jgi:predicted ArsR family transcriptional regulator
MTEPDHDTVYQFVQRQSAPFVTSGDVAEQFPEVADRTVRNRLNDLVEQGRLESRFVGAAAKVWYLPDQGGDEASARSPSSASQ